MLRPFKRGIGLSLALALLLLAGCAQQEKKQFIVAGPDGLTLHNRGYYGGTILEVVSVDDAKVKYIAGKGGMGGIILTSRVADLKTAGGALEWVDWDRETNRPILDDPRDAYFDRYYHFVIRKLDSSWLWVIGVATFLALITKPYTDEGGCIYWFILCGIGSFVGGFYVNHLTLLRKNLEEYALSGSMSGHFLPIPPEVLHPARFTIGLGTWGEVIWQVFFWGAQIIALLCIPKMIRQISLYGFYYLSPHPATRYLAVKAKKDGTPAAIKVKQAVGGMFSGDFTSPPSAFVSEVRKKQSEALKERLQAETDLLNSLVDRERKRAALDDERGEK